MKNKRVLDVCCGSRMWHFNKYNEDIIFMDNRKIETNLCDGRKFEVNPNIVGDFRNIPFDDGKFDIVLFDPPHLIRAGDKSFLAIKYGKLNKEWKEDMTQGFKECFRVLKKGGTLIFKWNENQLKIKDVLNCTDEEALVGHRRGQTHFIVFYKK